MTLRLAVGPIAINGTDDWPLLHADELAKDGVHIYPFEKECPTFVDAVIWWSLEYHPVDPTTLPGFRTVVIGDWHILDPAWQGWDMVVGDYRYCKAHPKADALYWRQFSWDERFHFPPEHEARTIDVAFMGRRDGGKRDAFLQQVREICDRRGWHQHIQATGTDLFKRGEEGHVYRNAKVVINLSQRGELNLRTYEAAACGALSMIEMSNAELWQSKAPLVPWQESTLEAQLAEWLADEPARLAKVQEQQKWVQSERPVDHLRWLVKQIKERMEQDGVVRGSELGIRIGGLVGEETDTPTISTPVLGNNTQPARLDVKTRSSDTPTLDEQRLDCAALVPLSAKTLLDVGCNTGGFLWGLQKARPGMTLAGLDIDRAAVETAIARLPGVTVWSGDVANAGEWKDDFLPGIPNYDAITCLDILEHVISPAHVLARLRHILTPDGVLIASIPNVACLPIIWDLLTGKGFPYHTPGRTQFQGPPSNIRCSDHWRFFALDDIEGMFTRAGYKIERWESTGMLAPSLDRVRDDMAYLLATHGQDAERFKAESLVAQWLIVAKPDWSIVADPDSMLPT